jgi:hypothetical protein
LIEIFGGTVVGFLGGFGVGGHVTRN